MMEIDRIFRKVAKFVKWWAVLVAILFAVRVVDLLTFSWWFVIVPLAAVAIPLLIMAAALYVLYVILSKG